ncbi:hypothetical protein ACFV4F_43000 [Kitasatospora sp. NPDC059722]|uniref:hypothetical protein n=1 Tax=unclassified Kitasatospora TaxID=2633591 RepID=UPI003662D067
MPMSRKVPGALAVLVLTAGLVATAPSAGAAPGMREASARPAVTADCSVHGDGRLWCGNNAGARAFADRSYRSATRGTLVGGYNWFDCWGHGDTHPGGNDIWYWTQTDQGPWGNVPAVDVFTSSDPAPGLRQC